MVMVLLDVYVRAEMDGEDRSATSVPFSTTPLSIVVLAQMSMSARFQFAEEGVTSTSTALVMLFRFQVIRRLVASANAATVTRATTAACVRTRSRKELTVLCAKMIFLTSRIVSAHAPCR